MAKGIVWLVYDMDRSAPAREFEDRTDATIYCDRKRRETGAHWVVRWRHAPGATPIIEIPAT